MNRFFLIALFFLIFSYSAEAQQSGPFYRQFFQNPYLFNPAYVGSSNITEADLVYRQQWSNFKDSPRAAGFSMQFPATERVALGFNIMTDRQVLLHNSSFNATFGYILPIARNHSLRFGISGGVGMNKLDVTVEELNASDPVIRNAASNNFYVDGNFGMLYTNNGLRLGIALTQLFKSNAFNKKSFNDFELSNLRNRLFSASYRFNVGVGENIAVEPYLLYRQSADARQDSWEAATMVYFKKHLWTGLSYHQHNGLALFMGVNLKDKFRVSYSYEFPPFKSAMASASSHELHLGIRFASKKSKKIVKKAPQVLPQLANEQQVTRVQEQTAARHLGNKNPARFVSPEPELLDTKTALRAGDDFHETPERTVSAEKKKEIITKNADASKTRESFTVRKGNYYVVVSVFSVLSHSMKFSRDMIQKGYPVNIVLNPKNNLYYVYIFTSPDAEVSKRVRNEYRWKNLFKEAWIFTLPD